MRHQVVHFGVEQIGRRAATKVQLLDLVHSGKQLALHRDFTLEVIEVGGGPFVFARDDLVAGAVVADAVAERNVHVQRQRASAALASGCHGGQIVVGAEPGIKAIGSGIRGIARPGLAQPGQQRTIELGGGKHNGGTCSRGEFGVTGHDEQLQQKIAINCGNDRVAGRNAAPTAISLLTHAG
jgi:hypothetical protein